MQIKQNLKLYILACFILVNSFIWYAIFYENRDFLTVAFLDVGQGDAIFIESPDGKQILIDGGANGQVLRRLGKIMPFYDRTIDMVVLTHPDQDHVGGLPVVLENYKINFVLESGIFSDNKTYEEFEKIIKEKGVQKILAEKGLKIPLCNLVDSQLPQNCQTYLEVLFPVSDIDIKNFETNTASVILKLTHYKKTFLFTGDSPQGIENFLVQSLGDYLDVDVLKLGHHGSKTSTSDLFLGFVSPDYTIASVGKDNSYGHPHKEVVDLLENFNIPLLRTDEVGDIIFKSDGESLFVK